MIAKGIIHTEMTSNVPKDKSLVCFSFIIDNSEKIDSKLIIDILEFIQGKGVLVDEICGTSLRDISEMQPERCCECGKWTCLSSNAGDVIEMRTGMKIENKIKCFECIDIH